MSDTQIPHRARFIRFCGAEGRLLGLNTAESESVLEAAQKKAAGGGASINRVENHVKQLHNRIVQDMGKIGLAERIFGGGLQRAVDRRIDAALDEAAEKEIKMNTDAYVSYLGGFLKFQKYDRFVALKTELREARRQDVLRYVQTREQQIEKTRFAAGVSQRLRKGKGFISLSPASATNLRSHLERQKKRIDADRNANARSGITVPNEWKEAMAMEDQLYTQLSRFNVVAPELIDSFLEDNASGRTSLLEAIKSSDFREDPSDPASPPDKEVKALCLQIAKTLRTRLFNSKFKGYRAYRLTRPDINGEPLPQRLKTLAASDRLLGTHVQANGMQLQVRERSEELPQAIILTGPRGALFVLDTESHRLTWADKATGKPKHAVLTEKNFSILRR